MKTLAYCFLILLVVIMEICGLALLISGVYHGNISAIVIGTLGTICPIIIIKVDDIDKL